MRAARSRGFCGQLLDPINRTKEDSQALNLHPACRFHDAATAIRGPAAGDRGGVPPAAPPVRAAPRSTHHHTKERRSREQSAHRREQPSPGTGRRPARPRTRAPLPRRQRPAGSAPMGGRPMDFPDEEPYEDEIDDDSDGAERMNVTDLKLKSMQELTELAEALAVENAAGLRKQDLIFADPEGPDREEGQDLRRGRARDAARRLRLPARARTRTTCPARTTSTSRRRRSAASTCAPATPSSGRSGRPRKASATSRCSRSSRSTSSRPRRRGTRSCSTT